MFLSCNQLYFFLSGKDIFIVVYLRYSNWRNYRFVFRLEGQIMSNQIIVPNLGNEVLEAEVMEWMIDEGETIKAGEVLVTISTSKTEIEIEAPRDGTLATILVREGELTTPGTVLGEIH